MNSIPTNAVERLCRYRRLLLDEQVKGREFLYSHELAALANLTPAQVRRDLMLVAQSGNPRKGYAVKTLIDGIGKLLDGPEGLRMLLVGAGNLGRAMLTYFMGRRPNLSIVAAFDVDPDKAGRVIAGCRCYAMSELARVVQEEKIVVGILTVPASDVQTVADQLTEVGLKGLINFAPVPIRVPPDVFVEDVDITMLFEKTAFFARQRIK